MLFFFCLFTWKLTESHSQNKSSWQSYFGLKMIWTMRKLENAKFLDMSQFWELNRSQPLYTFIILTTVKVIYSILFIYVYLLLNLEPNSWSKLYDATQFKFKISISMDYGLNSTHVNYHNIGYWKMIFG